MLVGGAIAVAVGVGIAYVVWSSLRTTFHREDLIELNRMRVTVPTGLLYWSASSDTHCGVDCAGAMTDDRYLVPCESTDAAFADVNRDLGAQGFPTMVETFVEAPGRGSWQAGPVTALVSTGKVWASVYVSKARGPVNAVNVTEEQLAQGCSISIRLSVEDRY